ALCTFFWFLLSGWGQFIASLLPTLPMACVVGALLPNAMFGGYGGYNSPLGTHDLTVVLGALLPNLIIQYGLARHFVYVYVGGPSSKSLAQASIQPIAISGKEGRPIRSFESRSLALTWLTVRRSLPM